MDIKAYISSGIIESYVLGLASEEEVSILNCIRQNNAEVEQAILEAESVLEGLANMQAIGLPSYLKQDIWNRIEAENLAVEEEDENAEEESVRSAGNNKPISGIDRKQWTSYKSQSWAIAASLLLAISIGANIILYQRNDKTNDKLNHTLTRVHTEQNNFAKLKDKWLLVQNPAIKTIPLKGVENKSDFHALVFWDQVSKTVYLSLEHMPVIPKGKQYQLWAMVDGKPVNAGIFPLDTVQGDISKMLDIPEAQAFAITLEDEGGKDAPTLSDLYVIGSI